ncbi:MAG: ABC transporter ATP-binding protein [Anaerolineae bacterium]|nr:ABC transporter ATP-binding protein [Anaerolineae bacterium]
MIRTEGLYKLFDDFVAVRGIDLHVPKGEILALLGPNGAGKTTTVRMLASILSPNRGRAWIDGHDVVEDAIAVRRLVGVLTEMPGLYGRMKAREYLRFFGELQGMDRPIIDARSEQLMAQFGMDGVWGLRLGEYSKGMRQKMALIRTMLHDPPVLLLDEPTSAMDPHSAKQVRDAILTLRSADRAIIICTHNLSEAELIADRIAIIRRGEIVVRGTSEQLKRELLGAPILEVRTVNPVNGAARLVGDLVDVESQGETWLRYRTDAPERVNPALLDRLSRAGYQVLTLSEVPRPLEEVYLQVVEKRSSAEEVRQTL